MAKISKTKRPLPGKLDLVFSTFIEITGLITTGATMTRIVLPILTCACEILSGKAGFTILEDHGKHKRICYPYGGRRGRPSIREETIRLRGFAREVYDKRKVNILGDSVSKRRLAGLTGLTDGLARASVITAPLEYQKTKIGLLGVITSGHLPDSQDLGLFDLLAREAGVAIKNAREFEHTQTLSITDGLTGAYNFRFLIDAIRKEIGRAQRFEEIFSIIMLDVDSLKEHNDVHGHLKGSGVIKRVALIVMENLRAIDMLCKYGGDEFVVVLPRTDKAGAAKAAERIRAAIDKYGFPGERLTGKITASMGIASFPEDGDTVQSLISSADRALYRAKRHGRNMVWLSGEKTPYSHA